MAGFDLNSMQGGLYGDGSITQPSSSWVQSLYQLAQKNAQTTAANKGRLQQSPMQLASMQPMTTSQGMSVGIPSSGGFSWGEALDYLQGLGKGGKGGAAEGAGGVAELAMMA